MITVTERDLEIIKRKLQKLIVGEGDSEFY